MKALISVFLAAAAVGVVAAPAAQADDQSFLSFLAEQGAPVESDDVTAVTKLGYMVCDNLYTRGWSDDRAVTWIMTQESEATPHRAELLVTAAHSKLCPDA